MHKIIRKKEKLPIPNKILLVDDDPIFREEFKDCFEEYGIREAASGEEALRILKMPNEIDLVILDVKMYGMDGIEVLSRIKEMDPTLTTIILTASGSKDTVIDALKARADDYIEKPLDIEATREIIEQALDAKVIKEKSSLSHVEDKIKRIKNFIERNALKKVSLKDAANIVSLSPKYLSRIFEEQTGKGFNEYRLKLKVERAKEILAKTSYTIDEIADRLGYKNTESFTRIFKGIDGHTPTAYRKIEIRKKRLKRK
jgi:two-component system, response regulator YesN